MKKLILSGIFLALIGIVSNVSFSLEEKPLIVKAGNQQNPFIVFISTYRYYLLLWEDWENPEDSSIYGQFFKEDGTSCGAPFVIAGFNDGHQQTNPKAAYASNANLVVISWQDTRGDEESGFIFYKPLYPPTDCSQQPKIGKEIPVGFKSYFGEKLLNRFKPYIVYDRASENFVLVWVEKRNQSKRAKGFCFTFNEFDETFGDNSFIGYLILNKELNPVKGPTILTNTNQATARLISISLPDPNTTLFVYEHFDNVDNVRIDCDSSTGICLLVFEGIRFKTEIICKGDITNAQIEQVTSPFEGEDNFSHIFASTLDQIEMEGNLLIRVDISDYSSHNPYVRNNPIEGKFLIVWEDYRDNSELSHIYGQIITLTGNLYATNFPVSINPNSSQASPFIVYDISSQLFLVLWQENKSEFLQSSNVDIYGQYVNSGGVLKGQSIEIITDATGNQLAPTAVYNPYKDEIFIVWKDDRYSDVTGADIFGLIKASVIPETDTNISDIILENEVPSVEGGGSGGCNAGKASFFIYMLFVISLIWRRFL